jgi:hypothetical protein
MPNQAFVFAEAEVWAKPAGLASQSVGFVSGYSLDRTPITVEDGSASFYRDRFVLETPWVDADPTVLFYAQGPFDFIFVRWTNEDQRLESAAVTKAVYRGASRRPGPGGVEVFSFTFEANSLA